MQLLVDLLQIFDCAEHRFLLMAARHRYPPVKREIFTTLVAPTRHIGSGDGLRAAR